MELDVAKAILQEAVTGEFQNPDEVPEDEAGITALADWYVEEANKAYAAGVRYDELLAILRLADPSWTEEVPENYSPVVGGMEPVETPPWEEDKKVEDSYPRRSSGGLSESDEREGTAALKELVDAIAEHVVITTHSDTKAASVAQVDHLPVPHEWQDEPSELPRDFTQLSDREVRKLSSEYNAYFTRTLWLLAIERSDLANATHLLDDAQRKALLQVEKKDSSGKAKTIAVMEAEAGNDPDVQTYSGKVYTHEDRIIVLKALSEIYSSNIERLSREASMRKDEFERSK